MYQNEIAKHQASVLGNAITSPTVTELLSEERDV